MLILKPEGLFAGDRVRHCSDTAQLHWPRIFLASNGLARIELNYFKIVSAAYGSFAVKPTQAELESHLLEYMNNDLLFPYEHDGQIWGQWDAIQRHMPSFKTAEDKRSPAPPEPAFTEWRDAYYEKKKTSSISKIFPKSLRNSSEGFSPVVVVVGVVVVEDVDVKVKNIGSSNGDDQQSLPGCPASSSHDKYAKADDQFRQWWEIFPNKRGRKKALEIFRHAVTSVALFETVMSATRAQLPEIMAREPEYRPRGSTWLNQERWNDPVDDEAKRDPAWEAIQKQRNETND